MKVLHGFVDPIVASAIQKKRAGTQKDDDTLLQNLVKSTEGTRWCIGVLDSALIEGF